MSVQQSPPPPARVRSALLTPRSLFFRVVLGGGASPAELPDVSSTGIRILSVENVTRGTILATRCAVADGFWSRGVGLLGRAGLADGEALLLTRTSTITMLLMRFAIDAVFVDRTSRVVRVASRIRPWVPVISAGGADAAIELPAGAAERSGTQAGDVLRISMTPKGDPHEGAAPPQTPA